MQYTIPCPARSNNKIVGDFYPLQQQEILAIAKHKLKGNALIVHLALRYENPFCDRKLAIDPKKFAERWGLPESSVYAAIAKLKKLGIITLEESQLLVGWGHSKNQDGHPTCHPQVVARCPHDYQIDRSIIKTDNPLSDLIMDYQNCENTFLEPLPSNDFTPCPPQTIQTIQTIERHDAQNQKFLDEEKDRSLETLTEDLDRTSSVAIAKTIHDDKSSAAQGEVITNTGVRDEGGGRKENRTNSYLTPHEVARCPSLRKLSATVPSRGREMSVAKETFSDRPLTPKRDPFWNNRRSPSDVIWDWLPEGPWRVDGKIDSNFVGFVAGNWAKNKTFEGKNIHEVKSVVIKSYRKNPENLSIDWDWYRSETQHRIANIAVRMDAGIAIAQSEQEATLTHTRALQPVPEEMAVTCQVNSIPSYAQGLLGEGVSAKLLPHKVALLEEDTSERQPHVLEGTSRTTTSIPATVPSSLPHENSAAYQLYTSEIDISQEEQLANMKRLKEMMRSISATVPYRRSTATSVAEATSLAEAIADLNAALSISALAKEPLYQKKASEFAELDNVSALFDGNLIVELHLFSDGV